MIYSRINGLRLANPETYRNEKRFFFFFLFAHIKQLEVTAGVALKLTGMYTTYNSVVVYTHNALLRRQARVLLCISAMEPGLIVRVQYVTGRNCGGRKNARVFVCWRIICRSTPVRGSYRCC